jgi:hypothetical protein
VGTALALGIPAAVAQSVGSGRHSHELALKRYTMAISKRA